MARRKSQRKPDIAAHNQTRLAALFKVSCKTVTVWLRRPDWPTRRRAPWSWDDLDTIRDWRWSLRDAGDQEAAAHAESTSIGNLRANIEANPERLAKLELIQARKALLKLEHDVKSDKYMLKSEVEAGRVRRILAVKTVLMALRHRLAPKLVGMRSEQKIGDAIEAEARRILRTFAGQGPADD